jgi:hypothetical protein
MVSEWIQIALPEFLIGLTPPIDGDSWYIELAASKGNYLAFVDGRAPSAIEGSSDPGA